MRTHGHTGHTCTIGPSPTDGIHDPAAPQTPWSTGYYSHSIVPGGLLVTSSTTRLTSGTAFVMRFEILASRS